MNDKRLFLLILLVYLLLATAVSVIVPLGEAPDEADHYAYARYIALNHALPQGPEVTQGKHPVLPCQSNITQQFLQRAAPGVLSYLECRSGRSSTRVRSILRLVAESAQVDFHAATGNRSDRVCVDPLTSVAPPCCDVEHGVQEPAVFHIHIEVVDNVAASLDSIAPHCYLTIYGTPNRPRPSPLETFERSPDTHIINQCTGRHQAILLGVGEALHIQRVNSLR